MIDILHKMYWVILFCPFVVLIVSYFVLKKLKMKQQYAIGFSADLTTILLFVSVPFIVDFVWQYTSYILVIIIAIIVALVFTFIDWRTKKEIEVLKLIKKTWRVYFVSLSAAYIVIVIAAIITFIIKNI